VYCGVIRRVRHTIGCVLLANPAGVQVSIGVCYWFFG
jgi:hypothetical protein